MQILELEINNFLSMGFAKLQLADRGLVLIQGVNKDEDSAVSNGSGKSTVLDAISWAIFGATARGLSGDDVIHRKVGQSCSVVVKIASGDDIYEIKRTRKDPVLKNALTLSVNGNELSLPTMTETDKKIQELVGMNLETFKTVVYCGQEDSVAIPMLTDKQLKELVEKLAGISGLLEAYEMAKSRRQQHVSLSATANSMVETLKQEIVNLESGIVKAEEDVLKWKVQHTIRVDDEKRDIERAVISFKADVQSYGVEFAKDPTARINEINEILREVGNLNKAFHNAQSATNTALSNYNNELTTIQAMSAEIERNKSDIIDVQAGTKSYCPVCNRRLDAEDIIKTVSEIQSNNDKIQEDIEKLKAKLPQLKSLYEEYKRLENEAEKNVPDSSALVSELNELNNYLNRKKNRYAELASIKATIQNRKEKIIEMEAVVNPQISALQSLQNMLEVKKIKLEEVKKEHEGFMKQITIDDNLVTLFGPTGIRAHILDEITPFLNQQTNKYLSTLSAGNLTAVWSTLTETKTAGLKEKFQIDVKNATGGNGYKSLSGGEKRKVNLACTLALQDLVASRTSKSFDIWIGDEIDDALDDTGLELLMNILKEKAVEKGTVLVISHNDLKDWVSEQILVVKENGISSIGE